MGLFSKIKKAVKFEVFNVKKIFKTIMKNPQRLLVGAVSPMGTKIANAVFGTKWKPVVNQLGGATKETFDEAKAKGMETGLAKSLHAVAGVVAGFYGGAALGNLASTGASQLSAGANVASNTAAASSAGTVGGGAAEIAAPVASGAASGITPIAVESATMGSQLAGSAIPSAAAGGGGMMSQAANVGKGIYKAATSDAGQMIIGNAMQGYAKGKEQEAQFKQEDKYKRAFTPEELAQISGGGTGGNAPVPGGYLDRARRVSEFLGDRGSPDDPAKVAGYARGEF